MKRKKGDLLVEFFSEEIPARMQVGSGEATRKFISKESCE